MICKNLLTLATFLLGTASAIKLTVNEDLQLVEEIVGGPTTISCADGTNVVCSAGTRDCFDDSEVYCGTPEPCQQVCPICTEDPCPPCESTCDGPTPPAAMESAANITVHLTAVAGQPVDDTLLIDRIVIRPTELPPNTILLPGEEVVDFDVHVYEKNGEPQDVTLTVDRSRNNTAAGAPLQTTGEGAVDMEIHIVQALNGTSGEIMASDIWLSIDRFINGTVDNGTNSTNITGGTCNNIQISTWSSTYDGETSGGSYDLCMDDCENAGGSVVMVTDD